MKMLLSDLYIDKKTRLVKRAGKVIQLSHKEFDLLVCLIQNKGKVVSRQDILKQVWQYSEEIGSRVADVYVGYLRKKIDVKGRKKLIQSIRGFGYSIKK
ncbi:MAG: Two component transcriptional regulator, winged helix family [Candidatus Roizmanbacteria bacterium GW2011_GWC2_37_13]|uniref:Two component transcriptional regulator, winged helix family n=1 Tax=Candidatus Roizmanbacteria bacterium GW2011_GWC2_37_13 TaxID=1618486 RepID=A0A0G0G2V2_9BACT|nr:MAG: Two component transcriptional regulator, winged helix family [Candidatus Roizmanbacteria bacterium GW2011_GWC1_37_12]KKQ25513.1 MAG: Two component transcriptional regulator, winged helix family [Candidatus Roizmanbacteria bacterium GW2011_GWC2_37_13]